MEFPATTWKLTLSYDGTPFCGWQVQPGLATVQGTLSDALARITGQRVLPQGSGRTDAGVHALAQVASFALTAPIPPANLQRALNRALPASIRVLAAEPAASTFHARHSALRKTYEYRIFERRPPAQSSGAPFMRRTLSHGWEGEAADPIPDRLCPPFLAPFVWDCRFPLQLEPMQHAAALLLGTHDFTSFAATDPDLTQRTPELLPDTHSSDTLSSRPKLERSGNAAERPVGMPPPLSAPNPIKTLVTSTLVRENGLLLYRVTGSGFLHHMVRNLVGTLVEIGRGALDPEAIPGILAARNRSAAGPTAPARGLFLVSVDYGPPESQPSTEKPPPSTPQPVPATPEAHP